MRKVLDAAKLIADHYGLEPGDWLKVTVNAVGMPSIEYGRRITKDRVEAGAYNRETPWREWAGPEEQRHG